jgi:two-component sensor histidine kinase
VASIAGGEPLIRSLATRDGEAALSRCCFSLADWFHRAEAAMVKRGMDWWRSIWGLGLRPRSVGAFIFALGCVAVATLVRLGLGLVSPDSAVFAPYYSATLVAALVGGAAAGGFAAAMSVVVAVWLFVPPDWGLRSFDREEVVSVLLFSMSSVVIIWAAESYRGLLARLREDEAMRRLLNRELGHRIKNALASVQAIVNQTLRERTDLRDKICGRIGALAATNDLLMTSQWSGASLRDILSGECAPYGLSRFDFAGEDIQCAAAFAVPMALVAHELATNASKYGALARPDGRISVAWKVAGDRLELEWVERGGPQTIQSLRGGFGTRLMQMSMRQFDGVIDMQFDELGLRVKLAATLPRTSLGSTARATPLPRPARPASLPPASEMRP